MILDNRMAQAHVSLSQAELTDMRSISMGWFYRTLLSTDSSGCSSQSPSGLNFATSSSSSLEVGNKFLDVTICSPLEDIIEVDVTVHYALAIIAVDTVRDISDVAMIIAYELLTTVRTAQNHVEDAADRFSAAVRATGSTGNNRNRSQKTARIGIMSDLVEVSEESESSGGTTTPVTPERETACLTPIKSMNLHVSLTKAYVAVLEDPRRESSSALLLTTGADAQLSLDQWGGEDEESQEALHMSLRDVQIHVLSDTGAWMTGRSDDCMTDPLSSTSSLYASRSTSFDWVIGSERERERERERESIPQVSNAVCEPFSLDIHFTRRAVKGVALASNIACNMGDVSATVSLPYLSLARSIMLRGTLSGLSPSRSVDLDYYCVFGDRRGDAGTQVDVYIIALNIGKVSIAAVNDVFFTRHVTGSTAHTAHESAPLVRLQLLSLHLNADGVINPKVYVNSRDIRCTIDVLNIEGSGKLAVGADFYNPTACHWEPLVEEWGVALSVTKVEQGISCKAVDDSAPLQVNISGKFLDVMINTYALWKRSESERKAFQPSVKPPTRSSLLRRNSQAPPVQHFPLSIKIDGQGQGQGQGQGHVRRRAASAVQDFDLEEYNSFEESLMLATHPSTSSVQPVMELEIQGPHLILHNRLLCDLHFKTIGQHNSFSSSSFSSSSSSSSPSATNPPSPSRPASPPFTAHPLFHSQSSHFSNLFYFSNTEAPAVVLGTCR
jgi:hypothetical protein